MGSSMLTWLAPTLAATFAWGIAQGLVKKYIGNVLPARFCLYFAAANAFVGTSWWCLNGTHDVFAEPNRDFLTYGLLVYVLDGIAWIFYFQSIVYGPISIIGTLSAAYPAITILFAHLILGEQMTVPQYVGVVAVIGGCLTLAHAPPEADQKESQKRWMGFAGAALLIWGGNGTIIKKAYTLAGANDGNFALFMSIGGGLTLGVYGFLFGRQEAIDMRAWARSFLPMATMGLGGLMALIAYKNGSASIVTPLAGSYPVVTLMFAMIALKERPTKLHWGGIVSILFGFFMTVHGAVG